MNAIAYGLDYGTSNSVISVARSDRSVETLKVGRHSASMPSLAYIDRFGSQASGDDAQHAFLVGAGRRTTCSRCELPRAPSGGQLDCQQYRAGSGCLDSRLLTELKSDLANPRLSGSHSWGLDLRVEDLVGITLRRLKRVADRMVGQDVRRVALGKPVLFVEPEGADSVAAQEIAAERLIRAARSAGFDDVELVAEPQAAIDSDASADGLLLALDFGGGTFDIAVVEREDADATVLGLGGAPIGGGTIDAALFRRLVAPALELDGPFDDKGRPLPAYVRAGMCSLAGVKQLLLDPAVGLLLAEQRRGPGARLVEALEDLLYRGQAWALHGAVESAKRQLTCSPSATLELKRHSLDIHVIATRRDVELVLEKPLGIIHNAIDDALARARVRANDVEAVVCTGGSSQIPAFIDFVNSAFPGAEVEHRNALTSVSAGLARWAAAEWAT